MSLLPTHDHDSNPPRFGARVDACATVALADKGATVTSTELDAVTSEAGAWLASLAAPVRVHGLVEHAPDITNQLSASWNDATSGALLLEQLLLDGAMQSLPREIAGELLRLYECHGRCRPLDAPNTTWELPASGLQDLQPTTPSRRSHT